MLQNVHVMHYTLKWWLSTGLTYNDFGWAGDICDYSTNKHYKTFLLYVSIISQNLVVKTGIQLDLIFLHIPTY